MSLSAILRELLPFALLGVLLHLLLLLHRPRRGLPPGPRGWPVLGALPLLGRAPHVTLAKLAKTYGPVMHLRMGQFGVVVASTPDAARTFLRTLDLNFSNRPVDAAPTSLYGSQDLVFAEHGPRWKLLRRLCNLHMLGAGALERWAHVRRAEVGRMLGAMRESGQRGEPVVLVEMLVCAIANMMGTVILSRRVFEATGEESSQFKEMVAELMTLGGVMNIGDFVPAVAWMDLQGIERRMKRLRKRLDALLTKMAEEHAGDAEERKGKPDLLDVVMTHKEEADGVILTDVNIKALLLNLFGASTDTSSITIEWAIAEMLHNPSIFKRAQEEMDQVIGRDRRLEESDLPNLPYLQAACKEAFRKHPSTPLNLPRISAEVCEVDGYHIPKNTRLLVNIWAIGRDPGVWENPLEFNPERFMSGKAAKMDPGGSDFELIPFSAGRRMCPGARLGIVLVEYLLGTLIHSFDWKLPEGVELNMDEAFRLALAKAVPVSALVTPRLAPCAYA